MKIAIVYIIFAFNILSFQNDTLVFKNYLQSNFNTDIPIDQHAFVILMLNEGCQSCHMKILELIENEEFLDCVSFIISSSKNYNIPEKNPEKIFLDKNQKINRLNLPIAGATLIRTSNKKIIEYTYLNLSNIHILDEYLEK